MAEALREAAEQAGVETSALAGVGVGSPGDADEKTGVVSAAKNLPGWEGSFPLAENLSKALGTDVRIGNDVQVATEAEFHLGAGKPYGTPDRRLLGDRRRRRPGPRSASPGSAAAPPARSATWSSSGAAPTAPAGAGAAWRPTPEGRRWRPRLGGATRRATKTDLFKIMKEHDQRPPDQRRLGARASTKEDKLADEPDRPGDPRPRRPGSPRPSTCSTRRRDHRRRPRRPLRRALTRSRSTEEMGKHLFTDDRPPGCQSQRWATWAARSAPRCCSSAEPGAV